jgi:hypothetical protein
MGVPLRYMCKVLGGGSSINVMAWSRGKKNDWEVFSVEAGDQKVRLFSTIRSSSVKADPTKISPSDPPNLERNTPLAGKVAVVTGASAHGQLPLR